MLKLIRNKSLKNLNTFGVDAKAKNYYELNSDIDIFDFLSDMDSITKPVYFLGGGANTLFTTNYKGTVVKINMHGITLMSQDDDSYYVEANAGVEWDDFISFCVKNKYYGAENLVAIPGTVGAAPIQNIGAYGVEAKDVIYKVYYYEIDTFIFKQRDAKSCNFGYRDSIFKNELKDKVIITKVLFKLSKTPDFKLEYGRINEELHAKGIKEPSISNIAQTISEIRASKLPDVNEIGNAGSFFKNPIISIEKLNSLKKDFPNIVSYPISDSEVKLAAGWLIDNAGLKGYQIGGAAVHQNQALVLINKDNATGKDVLALAEYIQKEIMQIYDVELMAEVVFV